MVDLFFVVLRKYLYFDILWLVICFRIEVSVGNKMWYYNKQYIGKINNRFNIVQYKLIDYLFIR